MPVLLLIKGSTVHLEAPITDVMTGGRVVRLTQALRLGRRGAAADMHRSAEGAYGADAATEACSWVGRHEAAAPEEAGVSPYSEDQVRVGSALPCIHNFDMPSIGGVEQGQGTVEAVRSRRRWWWRSRKRGQR